MRFRISSPAVRLAWVGAAVLAVSLSTASDPIALGVKGRVNATPTIAAEGQLTTSGSAVYPALAVAGDGVVAAWTSGASASSSIQVARLAGSRPAGTDR